MDRPIQFLDIRGHVDRLTMSGMDFLPSPAAWLMQDPEGTSSAVSRTLRLKETVLKEQAKGLTGHAEEL